MAASNNMPRVDSAQVATATELSNQTALLRALLAQSRSDQRETAVGDFQEQELMLDNFPVAGAKRVLVRRTGSGSDIVTVPTTGVLLVQANEARLGGRIVNSGTSPLILYLTANGTASAGAPSIWLPPSATAGTAPVTQWNLNSQPAANTQATATQAAGGAGVRHVLQSITASVVTGAVAPAAAVATVVVRDGASGAGPIIWQDELAIPAATNQVVSVAVTGLGIRGSVNTAMTVEFTAAGGANTTETISANGFDESTTATAAAESGFWDFRLGDQLWCGSVTAVAQGAATTVSVAEV